MRNAVRVLRRTLELKDKILEGLEMELESGE
jgi:hypothetical protein